MPFKACCSKVGTGFELLEHATRSNRRQIDRCQSSGPDAGLFVPAALPSVAAAGMKMRLDLGTRADVEAFRRRPMRAPCTVMARLAV